MDKNIITVAILTIPKFSKDAKQMLYDYSQAELTLAFDIIFNVRGI